MVSWFLISSITFVVFALTYLTWHFYQMLPTIKYRRILACVITALLFSLLAVKFIVFGFIVNICIAFVVCDLISLLVYKTKIKIHWQKLYHKGILALALSLILSGYGIYNAHQIITTKYTVEIHKSFPDTSIMIASDMHISTAVKAKELDAFKQRVEESEPDYIFLVGDIVDESSQKEDVKYALKIFDEIQKEYPIYFVLGNHELGHIDGRPGPYVEHELEKGFKEAGVTVLLDETVELEQFVLVGRKDARMNDRKEMKQLLENVNLDKPIIVLDHQPIDLQVNSELGVDIQISGHTHAGQMFPVGQISELLKINEMNYGIRTINDFQAIVTSGMGMWGYAMRTSHHSEVVELTLHSIK